MAQHLYMLYLAHAFRRDRRVFRDRRHPLDMYNDVQMYKRYRFSRRGCMHIIDLLEPHLQPPTRRNHAIPASLQVFTALRYYASGSLLTSTGDHHGISIASASRILRRVTLALVNKRSRFIKFPRRPEDVQRSQRDFFAVAGFPNLVGAVDGTHVRLSAGK